jgi:hypothetical protein
VDVFIRYSADTPNAMIVGQGNHCRRVVMSNTIPLRR